MKEREESKGGGRENMKGRGEESRQVMEGGKQGGVGRVEGGVGEEG